MPLTFEELAEKAAQLPPSARALLADKLVESLDGLEADEMERLWAAEATRRRDEVRAGQVKPIPGEQVITQRVFMKWV